MMVIFSKKILTVIEGRGASLFAWGDRSFDRKPEFVIQDQISPWNNIREYWPDSKHRYFSIVIRAFICTTPFVWISLRPVVVVAAVQQHYCDACVRCSRFGNFARKWHHFAPPHNQQNILMIFIVNYRPNSIQLCP